MTHTSKTWMHLPNAPHINGILHHLLANPQAWESAQYKAKAGIASWEEVQKEAWDCAKIYIQANRGWEAVWDIDRYLASHVGWCEARHTAWEACCALIAWDSSASLLNSELGALRAFALSGHYPATLLLPAVLAMKMETK